MLLIVADKSSKINGTGFPHHTVCIYLLSSLIVHLLDQNKFHWWLMEISFYRAYFWRCDVKDTLEVYRVVWKCQIVKIVRKE